MYYLYNEQAKMYYENKGFGVHAETENARFATHWEKESFAEMWLSNLPQEKKMVYTVKKESVNKITS